MLIVILPTWDGVAHHPKQLKGPLSWGLFHDGKIILIVTLLSTGPFDHHKVKNR